MYVDALDAVRARLEFLFNFEAKWLLDERTKDEK
jgi:hypothetical protein